MKKVQVWGVDSDGNRQMQGEIVLDDLGHLTATDGIATSLLNSNSDDGKRLITKSEPDAFINSLTLRYRSPYLRVTIPIVDDSFANLLDKSNPQQQAQSQ